jgi:hypothetical protein
MKLDNHKQSHVDCNLCKIQDLVDEKKRACLQCHLDKEKKGKGLGKSKETSSTSHTAPQVVSVSQPAIDKDDDLSDAPPEPEMEKTELIIPSTNSSCCSPSEEIHYSNSPIISSTRLEMMEKELVMERNAKVIVSKGTKCVRASPPGDLSAKSAKKGYGVKRGEAVKSK